MRILESFFLMQYNEQSGQAGFIESPGVFWCMSIICLAFIILMIFRKVIVCIFKTRAVYVPDDVLKKRRPFYINKAGWDNIRIRALVHKSAQNGFSHYINFIAPYYFSDRKIDYLNNR